MPLVATGFIPSSKSCHVWDRVSSKQQEEPGALMSQDPVFCTTFLINGPPAKLEIPSSDHLLYHGLLPSVSCKHRGT